MFQKKPLALVCHLCGKQYGTKSLPIHITECEKKWWNVQSVLPKHLQIPPPSPPAIPLPSDNRHSEMIDAYNSAAFEVYSHALTPCPNCPRRFNPDSLLVHLKSCAPKPGQSSSSSSSSSSSASSFGAGAGLSKRPIALICFICGKEFGTASLSVHLPQCEQKYQKQQLNMPRSLRMPVPQGPPGDLPSSSDLDALTRWNELSYSIYEGARTPCPFCGRKFLPDRVLVHIRGCDKKPEDWEQELERRPPPPPAPAPSFPSPSSSSPPPASASSSVSSPKQPQPKISSASLPPQNQSQSPEAEHVSSLDLHSCSKCGRKFVIDRLERHEQSCKGAPVKAAAPHPKKEEEAANAPKPEPSWKKEHDRLQAALSAARNPNSQNSNNPSQPDPSLQQCPHCNRRFNPQAAERHIPFCERSNSRKPLPQPQQQQQQQQQQRPGSSHSSLPKPSTPSASSPPQRPSSANRLRPPSSASNLSSQLPASKYPPPVSPTPSKKPVSSKSPTPQAAPSPSVSSSTAALLASIPIGTAKFCIECSAAFAPSARFCAECGAKRP